MIYVFEYRKCIIVLRTEQYTIVHIMTVIYSNSRDLYKSKMSVSGYILESPCHELSSNGFWT